MNVLALLFNLGFMTIKSKNTKSYELTFVNSEAIDSLKDSFLNNDNRDLDNVFTRFNPDFRFVLILKSILIKRLQNLGAFLTLSKLN